MPLRFLCMRTNTPQPSSKTIAAFVTSNMAIARSTTDVLVECRRSSAWCSIISEDLDWCPRRRILFCIARAPVDGSELQPFFKALVNQNFDIDPAIDFTAYSVSVAGHRMRAAIADGNENAPHWDVLNLIEVTRHSGGTLLAQLLIRFAAQRIGGVPRDLDQVALMRLREFGKIGKSRFG